MSLQTKLMAAASLIEAQIYMAYVKHRNVSKIPSGNSRPLLSEREGHVKKVNTYKKQ